MRGAFLITLAQLVTKILGAIHRPVSQTLIGDHGLALATPPSNAYYIILALSSVGLNVAISRLIAERLALQDLRGARRVFRVAANMLLISGAVFSVLFALGAHQMANFVGMPEAWPGFMVLSPALFFVAVLSLLRGLYQGMQHMAPSASSQVVEQVVRVSVSLALMAFLVRISLNYGAAAFNSGNTVGIFTAMLYLGWVTLRRSPMAGWTTVAEGVESYEHASAASLIGKILAIALPLALIGVVAPFMSLLDAAIVTHRLMSLGVATKAAQEAVAYLANAATLRDLPSILTTALYISLVPAIAESYATGKLEQARYRAATAFRVTFILALPVTVGLLVGAKDVYSILFFGPGWVVMGPLAWSTLFLMVQQTSSGTLQGMGRVWLSVQNLLVGVIVKVALTYWWTGLPGLQAKGAAYATGVGYAVAMVLNLWTLKRDLGLSVNWKGDVLRPALASLLMGVVIWGASPVAHRFLHQARLAGAVVVVAGGVVYAAALLLIGGLTESDLGLVPGVRPGMIKLLKRYRLLRN